MPVVINEVDQIEILALQDNYVDLLSQDSNETINRALPIKDKEVKTSIFAEHGFSSVITTTKENISRSMIFDFGFSETGAALNATAMDIDLSGIEETAISHGHLDHVGGMVNLMKLVGKDNIDLVLHPEAFRDPRFLKTSEGMFKFLSFTIEKTKLAGLNVVKTSQPYPLLGSNLLFLGTIPRETEFEKGDPKLFYSEDGVIKPDDFSDDTSVIANLKGKGLVVISGCAHSGMINTIIYAKKVTGVDKVYAIYGGLHLEGKGMEEIIEKTVTALKEFAPKYVVLGHCTGMNAISAMKKVLSDSVIMNMAGTKITFES